MTSWRVGMVYRPSEGVALTHVGQALLGAQRLELGEREVVREPVVGVGDAVR
jgi:hypothetical protein